MHKKTLEAVVQPTGKTGVAQQPANQRAEESEVAEETRDEDQAAFSKEELRENSIAALRAKAQEHSAKVLGTVSQERTDAQPDRRETGEEERPGDHVTPAEEKKSP